MPCHRWLKVLPPLLLLLASSAARGDQPPLILAATASDCTSSMSADGFSPLMVSIEPANRPAQLRVAQAGSPPPERGTLVLFGAGLLGLVLLRRRVLH
ncbi:MAG: hypothetical protein ACNA7W_20555 [Pseudomonadales bacterium]